MLQTEGTREYSEADALAIDALFKRIAARGRKIRLEKLPILSESMEKSHAEKSLSMQANIDDENGNGS